MSATARERSSAREDEKEDDTGACNVVEDVGSFVMGGETSLLQCLQAAIY